MKALTALKLHKFAYATVHFAHCQCSFTKLCFWHLSPQSH